jgi:hypothetical protein
VPLRAIGTSLEECSEILQRRPASDLIVFRTHTSGNAFADGDDLGSSRGIRECEGVTRISPAKLGSSDSNWTTQTIFSSGTNSANLP